VKIFLLVLVLFFSVSSVAQNKQSFQKDSTKYIYKTPYNPSSPNQTWTIKAFPLPFLAGDGGGIACTLGVEYGFFKRHSLGVDGIYNLEGGSHDMVTDTAGRHYDIGNYYSSEERAILISYRYYLNFPDTREKKGMVWYLSTFARYGKIHSHKDPAFINDYIDQDQLQKSIGILFGGISVFKKPSRMGFDFNAGIFYKEKNISTEYFDNNIIKSRTDRPSNFGVRIGLYIDYWFFSKEVNK
jgi:hypothetical protein